MFLAEYSETTGKFYVAKDFEYYTKEDFADFHVQSKKLYFTFDKRLKKYVFTPEQFYEFRLWDAQYKWGIVLSPSAQAHINDPLFKRETTFYRGKKFDPSILSPGETLYDFQIEGVNFTVSRSRWAQHDDAGAGKTVQALLTFAQWYKEGFIDSVFLLTKNGLSYHWFREILMFTGIFKEEDIQIIDNETKKKPFEAFRDKKILICSHHLLGDVLASYADRKPKIKVDVILKSYPAEQEAMIKLLTEGKTSGVVLKGLTRRDAKKYQAEFESLGAKVELKLKKERLLTSTLQWGAREFPIKEYWDKKSICLIADESHAYKHSDSTRSKALASIIDQFDFRGFLTATPAINRFEEYYHQMMLLDPFILSETEKTFLLKIARVIGVPKNPFEVVKYDEQAILAFRERMKMNCIKRIKEQLPEMKMKRIIRPIYFKMSINQQRLYNFFSQRESQMSMSEFNEERLFSSFVDTSLCLDNPELLKKKQYVDPMLMKMIAGYRFEEDPRLTFLDEFLHEQIKEMGEKIVVFDPHPDTLNSLFERYSQYKPLIIHGEINKTEKERQRIQDLFNEKSSEHRLILLSSITSSAGINLQKGSSKVVFYTMPWNTTDYRQAIDRTHRINSTEDTRVYLLVFDKTLDNLRLTRNLNRVEFNDSFLNRNLNQDDVSRLLNGGSYG